MNIEEMINKMSIKEKINICTGESMWKTKGYDTLQGIYLSDGPHGLRFQTDTGDMLGLNHSYPATCFPTAVTAANTFNVDLIQEEGKAIGKEAKYYGVSMVLGPGCNIKRNPLGGRNFEYYSEDPYLAGNMAASFIQGIESTGVMSSLKHFACNNEEYKRQSGNSIVDERTLRDIYLKPFEIAVKEGKPSSIMCSYNQINGTYASDHNYLLHDILRKQWNYQGAVITDWGAMHDRISAFKAGCDLNMPGGSTYQHKEVEKAIKKNQLSVDDLDQSVRRVLTLLEKGNQVIKEDCGFNLHHQLAYQIASEGIVLLKNDDILPLSKEDDYCLLGYMAKSIRYQGTGSSHINPTKLHHITDLLEDVEYEEGVSELGELVNLNSVVALAKKHQKVIIVAGLPESYESEAFDREHMSLPNGYNELIQKVSEVNSNIIVVLMAGGVVEVPWKDSVKGILYAGLCGQNGAQAIVDILLGKVNPSGKLAETWPISYNDVVSQETFGKKQVEYREGIYVGYRYYDQINQEVAYPFGHGLSYSTFTYHDLEVKGNLVSCLITNESNIPGKEVVQLYIAPVDHHYREVKQLKRFQKIELKPHQSQCITFALDDDCFSMNSDVIQGAYQIMIGSSSKEIHLTTIINIKGKTIDLSYLKNTWYDHFLGLPTRSDFEVLIGKKIEEEKIIHKGSYTLDQSILEMKEESYLMKLFYCLMVFFIGRTFQKEDRNMNNSQYKMLIISATDCPIRGMIINAGGLFPMTIAKLLIHLANVI